MATMESGFEYAAARVLGSRSGGKAERSNGKCDGTAWCRHARQCLASLCANLSPARFVGNYIRWAHGYYD
jgi:hypothetical protein